MANPSSQIEPTDGATRVTSPTRPRSRLGAIWSGAPGRILRVAFAILPLVWLSTRIDWTLVVARAIRIGPRGLALSVFAIFGSLLFGSLRWHLLLGAYGADPRKIPTRRTLLRHYLVGQYFNVLPSGLAGDAVRAVRVADCLPDKPTSFVIIFIERLAGLVGLLLIAGLSTWISPVLQGGPVAYALDVGAVLACVFGLVVIVLPQLSRMFPAVRTMVSKIPIGGPFLAKMPAANNSLGPILAVGFSVLTQLSSVLAVAALIAPLSPVATIAVCLRIVPALLLITYIPLTPGGLGQREAAFVALFGLVHVEEATSVAVSLLFFSTVLTWAFVGGLVLLYERATGLSNAQIPVPPSETT